MYCSSKWTRVKPRLSSSDWKRGRATISSGLHKDSLWCSLACATWVELWSSLTLKISRWVFKIFGPHPFYFFVDYKVYKPCHFSSVYMFDNVEYFILFVNLFIHSPRTDHDEYWALHGHWHWVGSHWTLCSLMRFLVGTQGQYTFCSLFFFFLQKNVIFLYKWGFCNI